MTLAPDIDRRAWLAARRTGITATDVSAIVGLHPFKTALQVWFDKVNDDDQELDHEAVEWGNRLEPLLAEKFVSVHPEFVVLPSPGLVAHHERDWMLATPDRELSRTVDLAATGLLELKTAGARQAFRWKDDETPDEYVIQVQWQMAVTGHPFAYIGALIAGQSYIERLVERDDDLIDLLITKAEAFLTDHVHTGIPPIADPWRDAQLLARIYHVEQGATVELEDEARLAISDLASIRAQISELEKAKAEAEATVKQTLGDAEIGLVEGQIAVTWKQSHRTQFDKKALATDHPDLVAKFTTTKPVRTFLPKELP